MDIKNKVIEILASKNINLYNINENDLLTSLGLDSLDLVEISIDIEDAFSIEFTSEEIGSLTTIRSLLDLIEEKIQ